jgi:hypothetical protein
MAFKNLFQNKGRKQGQVITQLNKLIRQNIQLVLMRERVYIKQMVMPNNSLYWMELRDGSVTTAGIVDHKQTLIVDNEEYWVLSHLIVNGSNPNHIQEVLAHINIDYKNKNLLTFCTPRMASIIGLVEKHNFIEFSPTYFLAKLPHIASISTDFFSFKKFCQLYEGAQKFNFFIYLKPKIAENN